MIIANGFSRGKIAYFHDVRKGKTPDNVDLRLSHNNIILIDEIQGRTIEQYTNDYMRPFIEEYNKGKKPSRQIKTEYTEWHKNDKIMTQNVKPEEVEFAHEFVLCYGNHEDYWKEYFNPDTPDSRRVDMYNEAVKAYSDMIEEFQKRYPHLHIALAVIHADEPNGSIHMHMVLQARATEYQRGLKTRISLSRALEQDGFEHIQSTSKAKEMGGFQLERLIKDFRHNFMNPYMEERGFTIKEEVHGRKREDTTTFIAHMQEVEKEKEKVKEMKSFQNTLDEIDRIEKAPVYDKSQVKTVQVKESVFSKPKDMVQMPVENFEALVANAQSRKSLEEDKKKIKSAIVVIQDHKDKMADIEEYYQKRINELTKEIKEKDDIIHGLRQQIEKCKELLDRVKAFLKEHNLTQVYEQWKTKLLIQREQSKIRFYTYMDDREQGINRKGE